MSKLIVTNEFDKLVEFNGEFEAQISPSNALIIVESVPDVAGAGPDIKRIVAMYNSDVWRTVEVK